MEPHLAAAARLATEALRALIGIPPHPPHMVTDNDARIGRLLMDAILLMENGPRALDKDPE